MSYKPEFKGPVEGWVVNYLKREYWRIERTVPREDVMQEAYVVFLRCKARFPKSAEYDTPQAFMAQFKRAWVNQMNDLSVLDTRDRAFVAEPEGQQAERVGSTDNDGMLRIMIQQAPREVTTVLSLFLSAPTELLELALHAWTSSGKNSAGGPKHLQKLLGFPPEVDPIKIVEDYFDGK